MNERVALLYGIESVKGERFQRVELEDSARWGLSGKGAILMAAAYPNRTSPVLRGAFILEHITGTPPAAPPPNVEALPEDEGVGKKFTTVRDKMIAHATNPTCFSCHGILDPLGFALENFDAVGTWRERDRFAGDVLDTSGRLPDGTQLQGPDDLREALHATPGSARAALHGAAAHVRAWPHVGLSRYARRSQDRAGYESDDYRFSSIVWAIVESEPFQMRQVPEGVTSDETLPSEVTASTTSGQ